MLLQLSVRRCPLSGHATAAAVPVPGSKSTHMKVNVAATFGQKTPPVWTRYSSSSPHPRFEIDTHEGECRCNVRSEDVPCLGLLHEIALAVPSPGRTRARTSCGLRRRDGMECRLYTHDGTKALIRYLHTTSYYIVHPRRFARKASYKT